LAFCDLLNLAISDSQINTSKTVEISNPDTDETITFDTGKSGRSGAVNITSFGNLTFNNTGVQSSTQGIDPAGDITITSPGIITFNNSQINSNTTSTGQAGSINVSAGEGITLTNGSTIAAKTSNSGRAGNITLNAPTLTVAGESQISAETQDRGHGGSITVNALTAVNLLRVQDFSPVLSVETSGPGIAGDIVVNTPTLTLSDTARITATATATATNPGGGGSITLNASNMSLAGIVGVFAETQGQAPAGTLQLNPYTNQPTLNITLAPQSKISASTSGSGKGGDLIITAPQAITIAGPGKLAVETSETGTAGNINISTQQLTLTGGAEISASTFSSGNAGNITVTANNFNLKQGAQIFSNTAGNGQAGNITLNVNDRLMLTGTGTGLFASTELNSTGAGGSIEIDPRTVSLQDGATIFVGSRGSGPGGNLTIQADNLILSDRSSLTAETNSTQGGDITLNVRDLLLLRHNSLISTTAGTAEAGGNGGNITINTPFVIGVLSENSDIRANAFRGNGGNVQINANQVFGLLPQPHDTPFSDITASSQLGISRQVVLNTLNVDPSRGLVELPINLVDPSTQIAQSCSPQGKQAGSSFVAIGRGGLPLSPYEPLRRQAVLLPWVTLEGEGGMRDEGGESLSGTLYPIPHTPLKSLKLKDGARTHRVISFWFLKLLRSRLTVLLCLPLPARRIDLTVCLQVSTSAVKWVSHQSCIYQKEEFYDFQSTICQYD
jgi:large exoprotein involved in heme utilization and adhesion